MNNNKILDILLFCTPKNILNCLSTCKQTNSINSPYFWKLLCERDYNQINKFNKFSYPKKYKILNYINKVSYITNYLIDELCTTDKIIITSQQLLNISINTYALKKLTNLETIYVKDYNPLNVAKLGHIKIIEPLKGKQGTLRQPFKFLCKDIYARSVICGDPN